MAITLDGTTGIVTPAVATTNSGNLAITNKIIRSGDSGTSILFPVDNAVAVQTKGIERLRVDSNGSVGIGTSSPTTGYCFDARGQVQVGDGGGNADINFNASNNGRFLVAGTERARIDVSGNMGIGTTAAAAYRLHTSGANHGIAIQTTVANGGAGGGWVDFLAQDGTVQGNIYFNQAEGYITFGTAASGATQTERIRIGADGLLTQVNATSGRGAIAGEQTFRLAANGAAIGPGISNYFGANSAISLEAGSMYEITIHTFFLKTTAGTLTWTLTASSAPTSVVARNLSTPITGTSGVGIVNTVTSLATAATAFQNTGSLTTGVNHAFEFRIKVLTNLATNLRLNATQSAGTITPQAGSYYTVKKISASTGTFVA